MSEAEHKTDGKEVTTEATISPLITLFRPSKLTTTVDKIWKTTAPTSGVENADKSSRIDLTIAHKDDGDDKESTNRIDKSSAPQTSGTFIFGQQIKDRVKIDTSNEELESTSDATQLPGFHDLATETANGNNSEHHPTDWTQVTAAPDICRPSEEKDYTIITGEEDESNLIQISCKLYVFDRNNGTWLDKGYSTLRINEKIDGEEKSTRIVIRLQGVPRLIVNSKLWPEMIVRPIGSRKLQFPATNAEPPFEILTCLILGKPADIEEVFRVLQNALESLKNSGTSICEENEEENGAKRKTSDVGNRKRRKE
ncbi:Ran BP1 domain containing protein [Trichuris trichiura]|uniref:Ran BP1 domain containing protein n=1 Tax=Trichuris trichiura TaxID=36087 RepID=A0A077Z5R3_TRITR|nr:Ran BP1 domain containing protein [Trichuris trichiura]